MSTSACDHSTDLRNPEERASALSRMFFWWVLPYLKVFRKPDLSFSDLIPHRVADSAEEVIRVGKLQERHGLLQALIAANGAAFLRAGLFGIGMVGAATVTPLAFRWFLERLASHAVLSELLPPLTLVCAAFSIQSLCVHHMFFWILRGTQRARIAIPPLIYRKLARLSYQSLLEYPTGKVVNLAATDANRIAWFFNLSFSFLVHPLQILLTIGVLYQLLGPGGIYGAIALVVSFLLIILSSRIQARLKKQALAIADKRVAIVTEALNSIKLIKLYGWEAPRVRHIEDLRSHEARLLIRAARLEGLNTFISGAAPALFLLVAISTMIARGQELSLVTLLPALTSLAMLRFGLSAIPGAIQALLDARVSARRIEQFLYASEDSNDLLEIPSEDVAIHAVELNSAWPNGATATDNITLTVRCGEIVVIAGEVGSGKSALLLTLHGELPKTQGKLQTVLKRQYVPQIPWIMSDTLRENILMGSPMDADWYNTIIRATALDEDISRLPQGDLTVIGERGVNLSGGQRQRVALARAAYGRPELLLLDDPLSALDPAIADKVFDHLLRDVLGNAAVVLVTHRHEFVDRCERAYEMRERTLIPYSPTVQSVKEVDSPATQERERLLEPSSMSATPSIVAEEERLVGAVKSTTVKTYTNRFTAGGWGALLLSIFVGRELAIVGLDLWIALLGRGVPYANEHVLTGIFAIAILIALFMFARITATQIHGIHLSTRYHNELARGIFAAPLRFFAANPVGRLVNRFSRDISTLDDIVPRMLHDFVSNFITVVILAAILIASSPLILIVLVPIIALYLWAQGLYRPASRECQRLESVSRSPILALIAETCAGVTTLRRSSSFASLDRRMLVAVNQHGRAFYNMFACNRWLGLVVETLGSVLVMGAFTVGVRASHSTDIAIVGLGLTLVLNINSSLNWLIRSLSMLEAGLTSAERIEEYTSVEPEERSQADLSREHALLEWPQRGTISFSGASFRYRADLPVAVAGVSATIRAGERIAIVGRTGAGKSTILLGLFRAIEQVAGEIAIDGVALSRIPRHILRQRLGYIPQEPIILSGTVRENLDPFTTYGDSDLWHVLDRVQLSTFVRQLPGQLAFRIDEGGANLSHGQRQLICLARVLIKRPKIVVLDEATSSVDPATDALIQRTLREEFHAATIITIAHRLETIEDYDRAILVDRGTVVTIGPPNEVLSRLRTT